MSLYNLVNGMNVACITIMPMLGRKMSEYPRFRDCFVTEEGNIAIYTRVGGGNRNCGFGEEALYEDKNFLKTYDDDFDCTYATYEFKVPEEWKEDFDKIVAKKYREVSDKYVNYLKEYWPTMAENGTIDRYFERIKED